MPTLVTSGFDPGDDEELRRLFAKKDPNGVWADLTFTVISGEFTQAIVECPVFQVGSYGVETLLLPRPEGDPVWPGMVHTPGVAMRRKDLEADDKLAGPFERIQREIGSPFVSMPAFVGVVYSMSQRGPEAIDIYVSTIAPDAPLKEGASWHPVNDLPNLDNFVKSQLQFIFTAATYFQEHYMS